MPDNKTFILAYFRALSGQPKTAERVAEYVEDAQLAQHIAEVEASFPGYELHAEDMVAERDMVMVRAKFQGVHRGAFVGIAPTGKTVAAGLMLQYRITDGKIVEHWMQFDLFGLLQQLQGAAAAA